MTDPIAGAPSPLQKLLGGLVMAVGILIATLSGLCSGIFLAISLSDGPRALLGSLSVILMVGGPPLLIGLVLIWLGRRLMKPKARPPGSGTPEVFR